MAKEFSLLKEIEIWNIKFPFDYIWRKKYKIAFNSEVHRNMDFFDIKFDIEEDKMIKRLVKEFEINNKKPEQTNQLLKPSKIKRLSKEEEQIAFDDLDLSMFDNIKV